MKMVKELLINYEKLRTEIALCENFNMEMSCELKNEVRAMDCLKKCIDMLPDQEADMIKRLYFEHQSVRAVAEAYGYSKSGIQYKRDKAIEKLSALVERAMKMIH